MLRRGQLRVDRDIPLPIPGDTGLTARRSQPQAPDPGSVRGHHQPLQSFNKEQHLATIKEALVFPMQIVRIPRGLCSPIEEDLVTGPVCSKAVVEPFLPRTVFHDLQIMDGHREQRTVHDLGILTLRIRTATVHLDRDIGDHQIMEVLLQIQPIAHELGLPTSRLHTATVLHRDIGDHQVMEVLLREVLVLSKLYELPVLT